MDGRTQDVQKDAFTGATKRKKTIKREMGIIANERTNERRRDDSEYVLGCEKFFFDKGGTNIRQRED